MIPKHTALGKSGKASTNGAVIKTKEKEEDGGGKKKRQRERTGLFDRYLKTTRTDEQERNVEQLHRHLYSTTFGDKSVVAVRVVVSDGEYYQSEDHLRDKVFGTDGDLFNLKSAYAQCSANQLIFNPKEDTVGNGASINNGVVTVTLPSKKVADGHDAIRDAVTAELQDVFDNDLTSVADYWMYCLPNGALNGKNTNYSMSCCIIQTLSHHRIISSVTFNQALLMLTLTGILVFTIMNGGKDNINLVNKFASICVHMEDLTYISITLSFLNSDSPSGQVHELGHNLNFGHSGEGSEEYADQTGMMGYSYSGFQDEGPGEFQLFLRYDVLHRLYICLELG